jgi:predicted MPP superfamily phosphohydrolase
VLSNPAARATVSALGAVAVAGAGALAYGTLIERNRFTLRQEVLPILEPGARSLTVLHLADLHLAPWQRAKQEWVRSLADLEPDLVVSTGDMLGHEDAYDALAYALAPFASTAGVYVHGSNDYYGPTAKNPMRYFTAPSEHKQAAVKLDTDRLEAYYSSELGWLSLNNTARAMTIRGSNIEFFGVDDAHRGWDKLGALPGAIEEMRENVTWPDPSHEPVVIGVTHAPYQRVLNSFVTNGANLILAGHTHGGQVKVPGFPALVTNCDIPRDQAQGLSVWHHARRAAYLNVSAGLGTSIYAPIRFGVRPEAVLVTLTGGDFSYS